MRRVKATGSWSCVRRALALVGVFAVANASGCKKTYAVDIAAVNALVPEKLKCRLDFEPRELVAGLHRHTTYTVPVPKTWRTNEVGGSEPVDKLVDGDSSIFIASSCDQSSCSPKDWNAAIDRKVKESYLEVTRDEHGDHRRVVVGKPTLTQQDLTSITVYWWFDGASEYHMCQVRLGAGSKGASAAFEKACELAVAHE